MNRQIKTVGVIGLGYVGLPLLVQFAKKYKALGFDLDRDRIYELENGLDHTFEVEPSDLIQARDEKLAKFSFDPSDLRNLDYYIVCVPTPIKENNEPDLIALTAASKLVGRHLKKGSTVVFGQQFILAQLKRFVYQ